MASSAILISSPSSTTPVAVRPSVLSSSPLISPRSLLRQIVSRPITSLRGDSGNARGAQTIGEGDDSNPKKTARKKSKLVDDDEEERPKPKKRAVKKGDVEKESKPRKKELKKAIGSGSVSKYFGGLEPEPEEVEIAPKKRGRAKKASEGQEDKAKRTRKKATADQGEKPKRVRKKPEPKTAADVVEEVPLEPASPIRIVRREWTPLENTPADDEAAEARPAFKGLLDNLRYATASAEPEERRSCEISQPCLTKRREIEVVEVPNMPVPKVTKAKKKAPPKPRKPTKKAQTITEIATAGYRSAGSNQASLSSYYSVSGKGQIDGKDRSKGGKASLLSPTSAQRKLQDQEFEFGTLSQLQAVDKSSPPPAPPEPKQPSSEVSSLKNDFRFKGRHSMWNSAARDLDGKLLAGDSTSLNNDEALPKSPSSKEASKPKSSALSTKDLESYYGILGDLSDIEESPRSTQPAKQPPRIIDIADSPVAVQEVTKTSVPRGNKPPAPEVRLFDREPLPKIADEPIKAFKAGKSQVSNKLTDLALPAEMPDFSTYTLPQLKAEHSKFGFKVMNKRLMIENLQKCWLAQQPQTAPRSRSKSKSRSRSPKPARKRRARSTSIEPKPKRKPARKDIEVSAELQKAISLAIKQDADKDDPKSFYSQMLMYDPVILEDLAEWLNTRGLANVGVDDEVGVEQLKLWTDANSICALYRQTNAGKERTRM